MSRQRRFRRILGSALLVLGLAMGASAAQAGHHEAGEKNPCAGKVSNPCNPCAGKAANPCAGKISNPCNPCAGKAANPCAGKAKNPCAGK